MLPQVRINNRRVNDCEIRLLGHFGAIGGLGGHERKHLPYMNRYYKLFDWSDNHPVFLPVPLRFQPVRCFFSSTVCSKRVENAAVPGFRQR